MESLARKGMVNNCFNAFITEKLAAAGIPTHFERRLSDVESLVKKLDMIPVECEVRNIAAGSLVKRLGRSEEHTSELQSRGHLVCRLLLEKKKNKQRIVEAQ